MICHVAPSTTSTTAKPEGLLSKMKDIVKSSVESLTHDDKKDNSMEQQGSASQSSGSLGSGSENGASAQISSEQANNSGGGSGGSGGGAGLMSKFGDAAKRGKEAIKEGAKEMKDDVKSMFKSDDEKSSGSSSSGSVKIGTSNNNIQIGSENGQESESRKEGTISRLVHKVEDKASDIKDKIVKPFSEGSRNDPKAPMGSSSMRGDDKSLAVELLDKSHEVVKQPLEKVLKPLDKALGYEKDPLIKMYDTGHEKLRHPLALVSRPVESMFAGAFKTSDEAKKDQERLSSEQERREMKSREDRLRKEGRSIFGEITDRSFELAEKPFEIILKPVDKFLGLDKEGKKNPLLQLIDELYGYSKKPVDALAMPFENILKKMADGERAYQVSVRFNADSADPKLFTRLADGALNIADRVITRPLEFAMRPLGFSQERKNPIVDATHSLKNATKLGVELFTRPIDRIIKEIADIGAIKDDSEREMEMERKRQEASRLVHALDKLHELSQTPWEIVLRPVGKVLGYNKEGKREPLLRAWDVIHQVVRTPIQVLSKPLEDAILGESKRQQMAHKYQAKAEVRGTANSDKKDEGKKNFFTEQIKKMEKFAAKPLDALTSPIRRLILGEDGTKTIAKAQMGGVSAKVQTNSGSNSGPDKIVKTLEQMNNVVLKPIEVITQPISDILMPDEKNKSSKKLDVKVQASASSQQRGPSISASASAQVKG